MCKHFSGSKFHRNINFFFVFMVTIETDESANKKGKYIFHINSHSTLTTYSKY